MVASSTSQLGIIKRAADPKPFVVPRYQEARSVLKTYLSDISRRENPLHAAADMFLQKSTDQALSDLKQDDARQSIEVVNAMLGMRNQLSGYQFHPAPNEQPKLILSGVEVSVRSDLWVHGEKKGEPEIGGAILRMTQDDSNAKREEMGKYVATLIRMHLDAHNHTNRKPVNRLCMSIDVRNGSVFVAPNANARRINDLEAACKMIHSMWGKA